MSTSRWMFIASICSLAAVPTRSTAQTQTQPPDTTAQLKDNAQDFVHDVLRALLGPHWNVFLHGGATTDDRYLLQAANAPVVGERALQTATGFAIGGGAGVDILLHMGFRGSYTYRSNQLNFRTNDGNGSDALNVSDVGRLKTHTGALEVMRYMLPVGTAINPYGTLGVQGSWWVLDSKSTLLTSSGASTPFSISPLFSFGIQFKATDKLSGRVETILSSGHNPFTGNRSFRATSGLSIDEPDGINHTDFRLAAVYSFGKRQMPKVPLPVANR